MSNNQGGITCALWCWGISFVGGILAAALLMLLGGWSFLQGVFGGFVLFLIAGALLSWILCRPLPAATSGGASGSSAAGQSAASGTTAAGASAAGAAATASAASSSSDASAAASAEAASDAASSGTDPSGGDSPATGASGIKPSASLSGEAELAERKGEWRYDGGDGASEAPKTAASGSGDASTAATSDATEAAAATDSSSAQDYDGDGVLEGADEGTKPEMLSAPREGGADNLKEIKGIGPKLEQLVNSMGVYHFDQIANWTTDEVAWVNANLTGFKGRVSRDNWIDQAKILAAGGETEFSKKVEKGGVYDE